MIDSVNIILPKISLWIIVIQWKWKLMGVQFILFKIKKMDFRIVKIMDFVL